MVDVEDPPPAGVVKHEVQAGTGETSNVTLLFTTPVADVTSELLATIDVAITATIFYALLPDAPKLTWMIFLGVYVASYTAGLAANLPGGIGVFEAIVVLALPDVPAAPLLGGLLAWRLVYYFLPLLVAALLFVGREFTDGRHEINRWRHRPR
mgnify:CR=1 FL=1